MKAMAVTSYGDPLQQLDVEEPELLPEHALLEIQTCGICFSDVKTARGKMPFSDTLELPHIPGHEICGRVLATDPPGVFERDALVVVYHLWPCRRCGRCHAGQENLCIAPRGWTGFVNPGGFQSRLVAPLDRLVAVPDNIDAVHAAPLTCALGTAYRAVVTRGGVTPGSKVAVIGLGGVGVHALQIARVAGARVVGLDISERALDVARGLDFDVMRADDDSAEQRIAARSGEGVDVVIDLVGRDATVRQADRLVRPGGRIVAVGYAAGSDLALPSTRFVLEEVELVGSRYTSMDELHRAIDLVASGQVQTVIDRVVPLEDANSALTALERGEVVGRAVLDVAGVT